jgi:hypothetical protein
LIGISFSFPIGRKGKGEKEKEKKEKRKKEERIISLVLTTAVFWSFLKKIVNVKFNSQ